MTPANVRAAMDEAERFIRRSKELLATQVTTFEYDDSGPGRSEVVRKWRYTTDAPKQSGAVRRASMDLTRALAAMRKP